MGVQGLTSFLANHKMIYREVQFRRSRLVIDGCNLNYLLYFKSGLDENHGGEYAAYRNLIENFITALRTCEITPYVVLDGGSDVTDKKVETVAKRSEDRVQRAHQAAVSGKQMSILPRMAELVFKQTLARLKVPVAQCYEEADQEIAALASEWQCPVLSNDSDFYIFDLPAGLLPISGFQWKEVKQSGSQSYISCRRYYRSSFCAFIGLQHQLLPTFAALAGNDYVKLRGINWAQFAPAGRETSSRLEGLLCWLKKFQDPQDALEAALVLMGELSEKKKKEVLQTLHLGMEDYQPCRSSLSRFFLHGAPPEFPALEEEADLIPNWMLLPLTQAWLFADVLDVLRLQTMGLGCAVEPEDLPSTNLTSSSLRQVMYGLLLGSRKSIQVDEIDRDGLLVTSIPVKPKSTSVGKSLVLNSLNEVALSDRLKVLLEALGGTEESLRLLPPQLKLPAAVTCYWMQRAQPPPDRSLLKALLMGMSNGNMLRSRTGEQTHIKTAVKQLVRDLYACVAALQNNGHKQKVDMHVAYAFNQWQACLRDSIRLNQLLHFPLPEPDVAGNKLIRIPVQDGELKDVTTNQKLRNSQTVSSINLKRQ
ncbi:hypothetical protein CRENBAI_026396 [Crenichthys baileyi]|uniref:XPG N-terminal domain-containing protein n=1 Tax=Crenichthys baileyi TaxID=28760 RepID=A0AAV9RED6_9TELE